VVLADDTMNADTAYRLALEGTGLLWRGDFQNARQLVQALVRRIEHKGGRSKRAKAAAKPATLTEQFHRHRLAQLQRARTLAMLLIPFEADYTIPLRRAPEVKEACLEAYGPPAEPFVASLRELLGVIGAHEWRSKGVFIPALDERIHPWYGVFSPVRGEYVELVAQAPLPAGASAGLAFDIGAGTGVLSAVLARRGFQKVVATDMDERALGCARANIARLGLERQVELVRANLFPEERAHLVVCNPPWLPGKPSSAIEYAIYDPDSRMLRGFLAGLKDHLLEGGEGWLILSDLAEHLGLRSREQLLGWIAAAGLAVAGRHDIRPVHPKASDPDDPLAGARMLEVTSLWRLSPT
jgi:methylase of polypeptide subunit release factors